MRRALRYSETILVTIVIVYLSLFHMVQIQIQGANLSDKIGHILAYALLASVWVWDMHRDQQKGWKMWIAAPAYPLILGALMEVMQQQWFPPRQGDWIDWLADAIGTVAGIAAGALAWYARQRMKKEHN